MGFLAILPLAAVLSLHFDKKIEETISPAIFLTIMIIYVSGVVTTFTPGVYFSQILAFVCVLYVAFSAIKNGENVRRHIFTAGLWSYGIYAIYFAAVVYGRGLTANDEFTHWALSVKNSLCYSDFSNILCSTDINGTYTPEMAVWEYYAVRLWTGFSEGVCMHAFDMLMISLILPTFRLISGKRKVIKSLSQVLVYLIIPFSVYVGATHTVVYGMLLVDTVLGMLSAYILYMFYLAYAKEDRFYVYCAGLAAWALCLTKEFGVVLTIVDLLIILTCRRFLKKKYGGRNASRPEMIVGMAAASLISWYAYLAVYSREHIAQSARLGQKSIEYVMSYRPLATIETLASAGHMGVMFAGLFGKGDFEGKSLGATADAIIAQLSSTNYYYIGYILPISFTTFIVLMVLFCMWHKDFGMKGDIKADLSAIIIPLQMVGCIPYLILLGFSYYILFSPWETIYLPSFDRYILPCIIMILNFAVNILYEEYSQHTERIYVVLVIASLLVCNPRFIVTSITDKPVKTEFFGIRQDGTQFVTGDNVYFVDQNLGEDYHRYKKEFYYYAFPAKSNIGDDSTVVLQKQGTDRTDLSVDEWEGTLRQYNYVYLYHVNSKFKEMYGDLFEQEDKISDYSLYKISNTGKSVRLYKVVCK